MKCEFCDHSANCRCPKTECPRHGSCGDCVAYHRDVKGDLPFCLRSLCVK